MKVSLMSQLKILLIGAGDMMMENIFQNGKAIHVLTLTRSTEPVCVPKNCARVVCVQKTIYNVYLFVNARCFVKRQCHKIKNIDDRAGSRVRDAFQVQNQVSTCS